MRISRVITFLAVAAIAATAFGPSVVLAQCGTAAGCGDASCAICSAKTAEANKGASECSVPLLSLEVSDLTPDELKLCTYIADLVEKNDRVSLNLADAAMATGLSMETMLNFDEDRIRAGFYAVLESRGFDTAKLSFGGGHCADFGACSVNRNLAGASGDLLKKYQAEKNASGEPLADWKAPDFTLPSTTGKEVSLSDFAGKPVALAIVAMHCNHCVDTMPMLSTLQEKYEGDLVILSVITNAPSVESGKKWAERFDVDYPVLVSTDKRVSELFEAELVPTVVMIDGKGFVTRKLVTFHDEAQLDMALGSLAGKAAPGSGSR